MNRLTLRIDALYIQPVSPLQEPTFLLLAALAVEPLYGYGIIAAVAELSEGRVELRAGTLYPALDRLTTEGLIELAREEIVDSRLRRYYRLTDAGADRLRADIERQQRNAGAAAARLAARASSSPVHRRRAGRVAPA
jgi:DNA-binding PadR family transcriptional regulator